MNEINIDLWSAVLLNIKNKITEDSFATWFDNTSLEEISDEDVTIGIPNKFVKTFLLDRFPEVISKAVEDVLGQKKNIKYKIVHTLRNKIESARIKGVNSKDKKQSNENLDPDSDVDSISVESFNSPTLVQCSNNTKFEYDRQHKENLRTQLVQNYRLENFIVGPSNRIAFSSVMSVLENPGMYNPIFLYGKSGLGKTHILHALGHELLKTRPTARVIFISCEEFVNDYVNHVRTSKMNEFRDKYRKIDTLIIDDIHFLGQGEKKSTQLEFFHTFDALFNASCQIIVSSDAHPKDISSLQEKIQMRFISGLVAAIESPDFATRYKILQQKCKDKKYNVSKEVLEFIASNITTNCRELEGALIKVHAHAVFCEKPISVEIAHQVLDVNANSLQTQTLKVSPHDILSKIADFFNTTSTDLKAHKRGKNAIPRQLSMLVMRRSYSFSYQDIREVFNCKSHASVMHGEKTISKIIASDNSVKILHNKLLDHLQNKF